MNKQNKQRLHELEEKYMSYRYPSAPGHIIPFTKYSDATANGLTKCITDFLNHSKHQAERINTMGVFRQSHIEQMALRLQGSGLREQVLQDLQIYLLLFMGDL
jgi:hypothetical protein